MSLRNLVRWGQVLVHWSLVLALSLSLALSGPFGQASAASQASQNSSGESGGTSQAEFEKLLGEDLQKAHDFNAKWGDLENVPKGQPRGSFAPDRFLLFEQTVLPKDVPVVSRWSGHVGRMHKLVVLISRIDGYLKQHDRGAPPQKTFEDRELAPAERLANLSAMSSKDSKVLVDDVLQLAKFHVDSGRRADTPYFLWVRRRDPEELKALRRLLAEQLAQWHQAKKQGALNPTEARTEVRARAVNWWDVVVRVRENDKVAKEIALHETARFSTRKGREPFFCSGSTCRFEIVYKGDTLHQFGLDAKLVASFGPFLVFTHKDSFDLESGVQYLSFIDLEAYSTSIGNEDLPVFRLPVKLNSPIQSLRADKKALVINESQVLTPKQLQKASDLQQVAFNLMSNLVDPKEWQSMLPLIDAYRDHVRDILAFSAEDAASEGEGMKRAEALFGKLGSEIQAELDKIQPLRPISPDEKKSLESSMAKASEEEKFAVASHALNTYHARASQSLLLKERMEKITDRLTQSRKLHGRISLLMNQMLSPKPWASQKIKEALAIVWVKRQHSVSAAPGSPWAQLLDRPFMNAGVVTAAFMATAMPETFHHLVSGGLGAGVAVFDYINFALKGIAEATVAGTKATSAAIVSPIDSLGKQYVYDGNWQRTLIGLVAFVPFIMSIYFVPHFIFNFKRLSDDLKSGKAKNWREQVQIVEAEYLKRQGEEEARKHVGENAPEFTEEDREGIRQWREDRAAGRHDPPKGRIRSWLSRWFTKAKAGGVEASLGRETLLADLSEKRDQLTRSVTAGDESSAVRDARTMPEQEYKGFWLLAKKFAFGYPAFELTLKRWATAWNWYAGQRFCSVGFLFIRTCKTDWPIFIVPKPVMFSARLVYPDLFDTVVAKREGQLVVPTQLNGGLRKRGLHDFVYNVFETGRSEEAIRRSWGERLRARLSGSSLDQLATLRRFEDQIIEVEREVVQVAFQEALGGLARFMTNKKDLEVVFGPDPLRSITGKQARDLSYPARTYLRAHFDSIYDAAMHKFMEEFVLSQSELSRQQVAPDGLGGGRVEALAASVSELESDPDSFKGELPLRSLPELKEEALSLALALKQSDFSFDAARARSLAFEIAGSPKHSALAVAQAAKGRASLANLRRNTKFSVISNIDPEQNPSMKRWAVVHQRLQSPGALGRAVRAEISKLLVTFPLDLGMKMFLAAGIMEGAFKPIQEEFYGPNSTAHFSHSSFYMIMASGFAMGMMADAWMKVQQDHRQDEMGEFGQIPKGEDAARGIVRWAGKQFFAPANSLWANYAYNNKLIFWNLPAALFNISLFYFAFSGRVDLSLLIAGYVVAFGTPFYAFHTKLDQTFERTIHYAARGLKDEAWLADPEVQKVLLSEQQRMRNRFTFWHDFFSGIESNWLMAIETIPTSYGPRGFARAIFGGDLIEESIVNKILDPLAAQARSVPALAPFVDQAVATCKNLLTRGNTDLIKIPGKGN